MSWTNSASTPFVKIRNAILNLKRLGMRETIRLYTYRIHEIYRDRQLGICTNGYITEDTLGYDPECFAYEAINYRCLDIVFQYLKPDRNQVFLDYGCGKGRALITAATYPFRRVVGVELTEELSLAAQENVQRALDKLSCRDLEIVTTNATTYEVPSDVTMIFLFNPFRGEILTQVQRQIQESIKKVPRRVQVVYMYPLDRRIVNQFEECSWLDEPIELPTADWREVRLLVYESRMEAFEKPEKVLETAAKE
jgi:precorrin-6B methylase 2